MGQSGLHSVQKRKHLGDPRPESTPSSNMSSHGAGYGGYGWPHLLYFCISYTQPARRKLLASLRLPRAICLPIGIHPKANRAAQSLQTTGCNRVGSFKRASKPWQFCPSSYMPIYIIYVSNHNGAHLCYQVSCLKTSAQRLPAASTQQLRQQAPAPS